jgi:hypothetical protein
VRFTLTAGNLYQRAGVPGNEADVGYRDPDNQHEYQRQDNEITQIRLPDVQGGGEQFAEVSLTGNSTLDRGSSNV